MTILSLVGTIKPFCENFFFTSKDVAQGAFQYQANTNSSRCLDTFLESPLKEAADADMNLERVEVSDQEALSCMFERFIAAEKTGR